MFQLGGDLTVIDSRGMYNLYANLTVFNTYFFHVCYRNRIETFKKHNTNSKHLLIIYKYVSWQKSSIN